MKSWANDVLQCAIYFQIGATIPLQLCANRASGQFRGIAIAGQMAEHDPLNFSRQQLLENAGRSGIGKMAMSRHDPLLHRPGPMRIVLQEFLVMIRFDNERMHLAQTFDQHFCRITKIGDETEATITGMKRVTDWLYRVVRDGKTLHQDIADGELGAGAKNSPVFVFAQSEAADRFRSLRIAINGNGKLSAEHFQPADVITVFMR